MLPDGTLPDDYVVLDLETTGVSCVMNGLRLRIGLTNC